MQHDRSSNTQRDRKRDHLIRTAEWVLAQAYRTARREEILASQLRVRRSVVREIHRRERWRPGAGSGPGPRASTLGRSRPVRRIARNFFERTGATAGNLFEVEMIAPYRYQVSLRRT